MRYYGMSLVILVLFACIPVHPVTAQRIDELQFKEYRGEQFNATSASYYGVEIGSMQLALIAGKAEDNYTVHLLLAQKSFDMIINIGESSNPVKSSLLTMLSYNSMIARKFILRNQGMQTIDFSKLDWKINVTRGTLSRDSAYLSLDVFTRISRESNAELAGTSIHLRFNFTITRDEASISIPVFTLDNGKFNETEIVKTGTMVRSEVKVDHIIRSPNLDQYRLVLLPYTIRFVHTLNVPMIPRYPNMNITSTFRNETRPEVGFRNHNFRSWFNWERKVEIDGEEKRVYVDSFHNTFRTQRSKAPNDTINIYHYFSARNYFGYDGGNTIVHDPLFGAENFIETIRSIEISEDTQLYGQLALMLSVSAVFSLIVLRRKK